MIEVFIKPETVSKMHKLLGIVGGRVVQEDVHPGYVHMIVEKTSQNSSSIHAPVGQNN